MSKQSTDYFYKFQYNLFWGSPSVARMHYFAQNLYWRMLDLIYRGDAPPDDCQEVAKMLKAPTTHIRRYWDEVRSKFEVGPDGKLMNRRAALELQKRQEPSEEIPAQVAPITSGSKAREQSVRAPVPAKVAPQATAPVQDVEALHPTAHPFYDRWKAQYNRYARLTTMVLDSTSLSKWTQVCSEIVNTEDRVDKLTLALDVLTSECEQRSGKRKMLRYPVYYLRDDRPGKRGEMEWLTAASNAGEIHEELERRKPQPFTVESVPWLTFPYDADEQRKEEIRSKWTLERQQQWIDVRLASVPPAHHERWYEAHSLSRVEPSQPSA